MPFVTFEGIEGMGKTTQIDLLVEHLQKKGVAYIRSFEPGATILGKTARRLLLDGTVEPVPQAELFLYLADRAQHVQTVLRPALTQDLLVLCDRYTDATLAYQGGGRGISIDQLQILNNMATTNLQPDLTILFDGAPEIGLARARGRKALDRMEQENLAFFGRVRQTYLDLAQAEPERFIVVDALLSVAEMHAKILRALSNRGFLRDHV